MISVILRFAILGLIWLALVIKMIISPDGITPYRAFIIVASAIIIFVPLYKKYVKKGSDK